MMRNAVILVFPAPAGMNRPFAPVPVLFLRVPRASGDEPVAVEDREINSQCSPRQRG